MWAYPRHNLALALSQGGNYAEAIRTYELAKSLTPQYSYLPYGLGLIYRQTNQLKLAEREFRLAMTKADWRAEPWTALGQLKTQQGHFREAEEFFLGAEKRAAPGSLSARTATHNYALMLASDGRFDKAVELWTANGNYLPSLFAMAEAYSEKGEHRKSADSYKRILSILEKHLSARLALANELAALGEKRAAADALETALQWHSDSVLLQRKLAEMRLQVGDKDGARAAWTEAVRLTRDPETARQIRRELARLDGGQN